MDARTMSDQPSTAIRAATSRPSIRAVTSHASGPAAATAMTCPDSAACAAPSAR